MEKKVSAYSVLFVGLIEPKKLNRNAEIKGFHEKLSIEPTESALKIIYS